MEEYEKIYKELLDSLPACIKVLNTDGDLVFLNKEGRVEHHLKDKTNDEIKKWDYFSCIVEEERSTIKKAVKDAGGGKVSNLEIRHVPGMTRSDICLATFAPLNINGGSYVFIFSLDITERTKIENELKKEGYRLEEASRIAHVGGFEWDLIENKALISKELYRILKIDNTYFEGGEPFSKFMDLVPPDDREIVEMNFNTSIIKKRPAEFEHRVLLSDNTVRILNSKIEVTADKDGNPIKIIGTLQDITERKEAEQKLEEKIEELERLNKHMVGRELKMKQLKEEINCLKK